MPREIFNYAKDEITVVWQPKLCTHSAVCFKGLPQVFDPRKRPWVNISGAETERIIEQVERCPSGALSIEQQKEPTPLDTKTETSQDAVQIELQANGPLLITGDYVVKHADGTKETKSGKTALCRCGASSNKPYCDGSHVKIGFQG
ncbi:MAG: hypothetical protein JWP88_594 [Flaviaesturariibacter sp.]|nr:hypothetical protein [Flaviaesturariibacter sp.]